MDISNRSEKQEAMADRKYIHWQADGVEKIPPNEQEDVQAVADMINAIQKAQWNSHRHCFSGMIALNRKRQPLTTHRDPRSHARLGQRQTYRLG